MKYTNIAAYKFVTLEDPDGMRPGYKEKCLSLDLKGTILLSHEGINLFLAGTAENIAAFKEFLTSDEHFADIEFKDSYSDRQPFNRLLIKLKKEIIPIGIDEVQPEKFTGPEITPQEFKQWMDEGRDIVVLDTRNEYEMKLGTFKNAVNPEIDTFRCFPDAVKKLPEDYKDKPVVMFCTGGIRCEKASPYMINEGFKEVYQLQGGILKYFEECGGEHYEGDCFVFDQRVALDPNLQETNATQCYNCLSPLTEEEQQSKLYVVGQKCPHCADGTKPKKRYFGNDAQSESVTC